MIIFVELTLILDDILLLIDDNGTELKEIGKGYDSVNLVFVNGRAYAHNKIPEQYYLHDINGNITSAEKDRYFVDYKKNCYFIKDTEGNITYEMAFW